MHAMHAQQATGRRAGGNLREGDGVQCRYIGRWTLLALRSVRLANRQLSSTSSMLLSVGGRGLGAVKAEPQEGV